jgi:hypothetical protein
MKTLCQGIWQSCGLFESTVKTVYHLKDLQKDLSLPHIGDFCVILLYLLPEIVQIGQRPQIQVLNTKELCLKTDYFVDGIRALRRYGFLGNVRHSGFH